jgi:hypothetical protein
MTDLLFLTIPILILWSWLIPIGFTSRRIEGNVVRTMRLPLLSRLKRHGISTAVTLTTAITLAGLGLASPWWTLLALVSATALVIMPQAYVLTTRGIRTGHGNFRRWTEFAGVHRSAAGATLQPIRRGPGMPIWLSGSREDDEFVHLLRTLIRDSYKGKLVPPPQDLTAAVTTGAPELSTINAYTRQS